MIVSRRNSIFFSVLAGLLLFSLASNHLLSLEDQDGERRYNFAGDRRHVSGPALPALV